jgi:hypothetical protein
MENCRDRGAYLKPFNPFYDPKNVDPAFGPGFIEK